MSFVLIFLVVFTDFITNTQKKRSKHIPEMLFWVRYLRTRFQNTIIMQIHVCSGREFLYADLPLVSKYGTGLILGCVIGPRAREI